MKKNLAKMINEKMMKRVFIIKTVLFMAVCSFGQTELSLNKAIEYALANNLNIKIAENQVTIAENSATKGNAGALPTVNAGGSFNGSLTNTKIVFAGNAQPPIERNGAQTGTLSGNVTANYVLFNGFMASNTFDKLELQSELAKAQAQLQVEGIILSVIKGYFLTLQLQSNAEVAQKSIEISSKRFERAQLRVEYGSANKIAMLNAKVDLKNDSIALMNILQNLENAKNNLQYLMGTELGSFVLNNNFEFEALDDKDALLEKAFEQNISVLQTRMSLEISEKDMALSNSTLYPSLSLSTGYSVSSNQSDASFITENRSNGLNGGINLSYNLFNGGKSAVQRENAAIVWENNQYKVADTKRSLETQINNAYTTYENNIAIYNLRKSSLKVNELNFERSEEMYKTGQITGTEFREAQLNLVNAQTQLYLSKISAKLAEFELLRLSGELVN